MVCVTPHPKSLDETNNTLQYAMYAKKIEANVRANDFVSGNEALRQHLQAVIEKQQMEIEALKEEIRSGIPQNLAISSPLVRHSGRPPTMRGDMVDAATECLDLELTSSFLTAFSQLEDQYTRLETERLRLVDRLRECDESVDEQIQVRLRAIKLKLALELSKTQANREAHHNMNSHGSESPPPAPAGVAYQEHLISAKLKEIAKNTAMRESIYKAMSDIDNRIRSLYNMVTCDELRPFNELLHKKVRLKIDTVEADLIASGHTQKTTAESGQKVTELTTALDKCTAALGKVLQDSSQSDEIRQAAREALAYARLPTTPTEDFVSAMAGCMAPDAQHHQHPPHGSHTQRDPHHGAVSTTSKKGTSFTVPSHTNRAPRRQTPVSEKVAEKKKYRDQHRDAHAFVQSLSYSGSLAPPAPNQPSSMTKPISKPAFSTSMTTSRGASVWDNSALSSRHGTPPAPTAGPSAFQRSITMTSAMIARTRAGKENVRL